MIIGKQQQIKKKDVKNKAHLHYACIGFRANGV